MRDSEGALSFIDQELLEDDFSEIKLKKPEYSLSQYKTKDDLRKRHKGKNSKQPKKSQNPTEDEASKVLSQLSEGKIPSAAAIHAARKKRELARNIGCNVDPNQISLKKSDRGNLISDDDDDNSDEGEGEPRQFGITQDASKQMRVLSAMDNATSGSDEEKFIEDQIYKGVYSFPLTGPEDNKSDVDNSQDNSDRTRIDKTVVSFPEVSCTPISVESVQSQLNHQLLHLKEQRSNNFDTIHKCKGDIQTASTEIESMERHSQELSVKYQFFQEIRSYIKDLLSCLTEKVLFY